MKYDTIIIDGRNLLYRCSDATSELSAHVDGEDIPTGGIFGFLNTMIRLRHKYRSQAIVAWEGTNNFRFKLYPDYKKKGDGPIDLVRAQFNEEIESAQSRLIEILSFAGVLQYGGHECEADDVMATLATRMAVAGKSSIVYSADSDMRQLVDGDKIAVVSSGGQGPYAKKEVMYASKKDVKDKDGVKPSRVPLLKAIAGDSSDNIPGLRGVGPKMAIKIIDTYGNMSRLLAALEGDRPDDWPLSPAKWHDFKEQQDRLKMFLKLTTLRRDVKLKRVPRVKSKDEVLRLIRMYNFRSLANLHDLHMIMRMGSPLA